jgi:carboxyl-terminal processing protease
MLPKLGKIPFVGLIVLVLVFVVIGCFFESSLPTSVNSDNLYQDVLLLDSVPVTGSVDSVVRFYLPILEPSLGANKMEAVKTYSPVKVWDHQTRKVVQYTLTTQRFGSWNSQREFQWNLFHLRSGFFFPDSLPDTTGLASNTDSLYAEVGKHDRFTRYVDSAGAAAERQRILTTRTAAMGLRLDLDATGDTLVIRQAVVDAPAWRAGLRDGMRIVQVGDSSVVGDSGLTRFSNVTRGDSGTVVVITALGPKGLITARVVKEPVDFPAVMVDSLGGIPIISLFVFAETTYGSNSTTSEFHEALLAIKKYPVFVLDIRDDPGGSLTQCLQVSDELVKANNVMIRQEQRFFDENYYVPLYASSEATATAGGIGEGQKVVLLADSGTASAAEILYVAVRDGLNAPTVGTRTYGKGIGQVVMNSPGGGLVLITHLKFKAPNGEDYHRKGLFPTHVSEGKPSEQLMLAVNVAQDLIAPKTAAKSGAGSSQALQAQAAKVLRALRHHSQRIESNRSERLWRGNSEVPIQ